MAVRKLERLSLDQLSLDRHELPDPGRENRGVAHEGIPVEQVEILDDGGDHVGIQVMHILPTD